MCLLIRFRRNRVKTYLLPVTVQEWQGIAVLVADYCGKWSDF